MAAASMGESGSTTGFLITTTVFSLVDVVFFLSVGVLSEALFLGARFFFAAGFRFGATFRVEVTSFLSVVFFFGLALRLGAAFFLATALSVGPERSCLLDGRFFSFRALAELVVLAGLDWGGVVFFCDVCRFNWRGPAVPLGLEVRSAFDPTFFAPARRRFDVPD